MYFHSIGAIINRIVNLPLYIANSKTIINVNDRYSEKIAMYSTEISKILSRNKDFKENNIYLTDNERTRVECLICYDVRFIP